MTNPPMDSDAPAKKHRLRNGCLGTIAVLFGLGVLGSMMNGGKPPATATSTANAPNTVAPVQRTRATARQIFDDYQANQLRAAQHYDDKALEVSGIVQQIDESMGTPVLNLATSNQFMPVRSEFDTTATSELAKISKGAKVTIKCEGLRETGGFISLTDCTL
jgi:tRNA_anti-like